MPDYVDHNAAEQAILDRSVLRAGGTTITPSAAGVIGLITRAAASQTANLQEWQDSAGTVLAKVTSDGIIYTRHPNTFFGAAVGNHENFLQSAAAARTPLGVRGAASQTASLQEWQNSASTVVSRIQSDGTFEVGAAFASVGYSNIASFVQSPGIRGMVTRGAASQTANLAEFQNSSGTVIAQLNADGQLHATFIIDGGGYYGIGRMMVGAANSGGSGYRMVKVFN